MRDEVAEEIINEYPELKKEILYGYVNGLRLGRYSLDYCYGRNRPYKVYWISFGDRTVNGKVKASECVRSRSFRHLQSAVDFMRSMN